MTRKLNEQDWLRVFEYRCRSKKGFTPTEEERRLIERAFAENPDRYRAMDPDVFDATVPFGSSAKARR